MKTRKLMAVLVMVAMIVTALPLVAFAEGADRFNTTFESNREKVVADDERTIKFTVYTMDGSGPVTNETVYFSSDREVDNFQVKNDNGDFIDAPTVGGDGKSGYVYTVVSDNKNGKAEFWVKSNAVGKSKIGVALKDTAANEDDGLFSYLTGESVNAATIGLVGTQVVEFTAPSVSGIELSRDPDGNTVYGNGLDYYEVEARVFADGARVRGEEVEFSANKTDIRFNKTTAKTNSAGVATVKVYANKPGDYKIKAEAAGKTKEITLTFIAGDVAGLSLESGGGDVSARDVDYKFKLKFVDINGNKVKVLGKDDPKLAASAADFEVEVVTEPEDSDLDDSRFTYEGKDDGLLEVKIPGTQLKEEGSYKVRAKLANGRYVDVDFEVKKQGKVVALELSYKQAALALGQKSSKATVKLVDADGVKKDATPSNVRYVVSDVRMVADVDQATGAITAIDKDKFAGKLVITAVDTDSNVTGTFDMEIGVEATSFEVNVPEGLVVNEDVKLEVQFYDANGNEVALGEAHDDIEFEYVVVSRPAGAIVSVEEASKFADNLKEKGSSTVTVSSNKEGVVDVQLIIKAVLVAGQDGDGDDAVEEESKYFTSRVSLPFGVAPEDKVVEGAKKVLLTIGNNFAVVDGEMEEFDAPAYIEGGRTYVPFRFLGEAFGAEVDWAPKDAAVETVFLTRDDMELSIGIGDAFLTVTKDGEVEVQAFDGAAVVKDGRTYLPFRAIAEAFEAEVDFGTDAEGFVTWVSFAQ